MIQGLEHPLGESLWLLLFGPLDPEGFAVAAAESTSGHRLLWRSVGLSGFGLESQVGFGMRFTSENTILMSFERFSTRGSSQ